MSISRPKRWRLSYEVQVASPDYLDMARTIDLSLRGLCIATTRAIPCGTQLFARLLLPGSQGTVVGRLFVVRWVRNGRIGLEASERAPGDEQRLRHHLASLAGSPEPVLSGSSVITSDQPTTKLSDALRTAWQLLVAETPPLRDSRAPYSPERS